MARSTERRQEKQREGVTQAQRVQERRARETQSDGARGGREREEQRVEGPERRRGTGTDRDRKRLLRPCSDRRPGPQDGGDLGSSPGPTGTCFQARFPRPSAPGATVALPPGTPVLRPGREAEPQSGNPGPESHASPALTLA